ncbi:MAG TPA: multicopper oxidase domain-containing protein, partial [Candidatus Thermoplasmatota archaeon]|nr:multicopper oxidase domain-containing protein [Candidatus Thermoplasmatota archaeon]
GGQPDLEPFDVSALAQPLVVRARLGECVRLNLTNHVAEPVSVHVHRAQARPGAGMALGDDEPDLALPGQTRSYVVYIPDLPGMEGAHFLHSHADPRFQTKHGLFGAIVAEPADASWLAPDGAPMDSGQEAIIARPGAADFREYVVLLHDEVELVDHHLNPLPVVSTYGEYGPGTKAINLRSEPFMDRFQRHDQLFLGGELPTGHDKSQGYGSYSYGDPAHFLPRAYVGDPTKFRLVNAGPGQHHVFHLHGGGDRWRASPVGDDTQFDDGLVKQNPVVQSKSERIDVQVAGPGESFNLEIEGGAGGVQGAAGDFLYHCHIVEHYLAGMFAFWRVHNTLQEGLAELPDRAGRVPDAVTSAQLLGRTMPDGTTLAVGNLEAWLAAHLPPRGVPGADDASAWDWTIEEDEDGRSIAMGEPETAIAWPNYRSSAPGERPTLLFNPLDGRPAFPFLRPHFGQRPPFAPGHGPAPHLGEVWDAQHPDGLCPADAPRRDYNVVALGVPVAYNARDVDPEGQVFALAEDKAAMLAGAKAPKNLVIRANQGDCVDVLLTSQLAEPEGAHSKVNMHIHLVQFDPQASDGVITGLNYEQSVRPAATTGSALAAPAMAGATTVTLADAGFLRGADGRVKEGASLGLGLTLASAEVRRVLALSGNEVALDAPLALDHAAGERAGFEFARYRWYADVELGMVYWHDHVDGLNSWRHGLFGGLVVEPAGSAWRDPKTGAAVREGTVADIVGPQGSFRELVAELQDRSWPTSEGRELASFNLRSAPLADRAAPTLSSGGSNGDPATDALRAYPGDPVAIRLLWGANANSRAVGTFAVPGHRFAVEHNDPGSRVSDAISFGISAQHNLWLDCGAGGCARLPGDYLYGMTQPDLLERGAWGLLRVHGTAQPDLLPLPQGVGAPGALPSGPVRHYDLVAMEADVAFNERFDLHARTKLLALASEQDAIASGELRPHPLVVRALPGELVEVTLTNALEEPVALHAGLVLSDPADAPVGANGDPRVAPGATRTHRWFADRELGAATLTSLARPADDATEGLYGALVVEPAGSSFSDASGMSATLTLADGRTAREHVLLYASDDPLFASGVMPYSVDVQGLVSVNYRTEPLAARLGGRQTLPGFDEPTLGLGVHTCELDHDACLLNPGGAVPKPLRLEARNPLNVLALAATPFGAPETPLLDARVGELLVVRALGGAGDQLQVHNLDGHWWTRDPAGGEILDAATLGVREASNAWMLAGPGGAGDYLWGSHRGAFLEAGAWGLLRVD